MKTAAALPALASMAPGAVAHADCGQPDQSACTGPVPTPDRVMALLGALTDPNIPAANKSGIVTPAFTDKQARGIDNNMARATVSNPRTWHLRAGGGPVVLANQDGRWLMTSETAYDAVKQVDKNQTHGHAL